MERAMVHLEYDPRSGIVELRDPKSDVLLMSIKLEYANLGTMDRVFESKEAAGFFYDCDNFWIGVKPADSEVFENSLFDSRKKLKINSISWENSL